MAASRLAQIHPGVQVAGRSRIRGRLPSRPGNESVGRGPGRHGHLGATGRDGNAKKNVLNEMLNQLSGVFDNTGMFVMGSGGSIHRRYFVSFSDLEVE